MKIHGQPKLLDTLPQPIELDSLVISASAEELRLLADFLSSCADDISANGVQFAHRELKNESGYHASREILPDVKVSRCV